MQILVVDDDPVTRQILHATLQRAGHDVVQRSDGNTAWEYINTRPTRFMITDWLMPGMDGPELIHRVREHGFPTYTYIIILTAKGDKSDMIDGLTAGADDYLVKPFDLNELNARILIGNRILELEDNLVKAREQVEAMAMHDTLTQLLNRRAIYHHAVAEVNRSHRTNQCVSLLSIDIDRLKQINDQYGPLSGDQAILHTAQRISESVRSYDWVGRWGGDEFLVVLPGTEGEDARQVAARIQEAISTPLNLEGGISILLTASVGITTSSVTSLTSTDMLLKRADQALTKAKDAGRKRIPRSKIGC